MDWKSGRDTNFAPLASATGEMDCRGFWDHGKPDKNGIWMGDGGSAEDGPVPVHGHERADRDHVGEHGRPAVGHERER
jgi:hypothetical protein